MAKNDLKTKVNDASVEDFINAVEHDQKRADAFQLLEIMQTITGEPPKMWGPSIIGFGQYHYKYASGREGDFMLVGFSPRKAKHSLYIMSGFDGHDDLLQKLGKFKTSKGCLYINKLSDVDLEILKLLIERSVEYIKNKKWP